MAASTELTKVNLYRHRVDEGTLDASTPLSRIRITTDYSGSPRPFPAAALAELSAGGITTLGDLAAHTEDAVKALFKVNRAVTLDNLDSVLTSAALRFREPEAEVTLTVVVRGDLAKLAQEAAIGAPTGAAELLTDLIHNQAENLGAGLKDQVNEAKLRRAAELQRQADELYQQASTLRAEVQQG